MKIRKLRNLILSRFSLQRQMTSRGIYFQAQIKFSHWKAGYSRGEVTNMLTRLKREGLIQPVGRMKAGLVYVTIWELTQNDETQLSP